MASESLVSFLSTTFPGIDHRKALFSELILWLVRIYNEFEGQLSQIRLLSAML